MTKRKRRVRRKPKKTLILLIIVLIAGYILISYFEALSRIFLKAK